MPLAHSTIDWVPCDGSLLLISDHQPLFSLIGWRFGGDRRSTFAVPMLRSARAGSEYRIATDGIYPAAESEPGEKAWVGDIRLFATPNRPAGWKRCDGEHLPIGLPFLDLFSVIGKTWGGDAERFALPDLRGNGDADVSSQANPFTYMIAAAGERPEEM